MRSVKMRSVFCVLCAALGGGAFCQAPFPVDFKASGAWPAGEFRSVKSHYWDDNLVSVVTEEARHVFRITFPVENGPYSSTDVAVSADNGEFGGETVPGYDDIFPIGPSSNTPCLVRSVGRNQSEVLLLQIGSDELLAGKSFIVVARHNHFNEQLELTGSTYYRFDVDIQKVLIEHDASIDSRTGYAFENDPPDSETGDYNADPNAHARNLNFGNWHFRGGLFVGNMPLLTGDQSRTGRLQLSATPVSPPQDHDVDLMILSMMHMGKPNGSETATFGAFLPALESEMDEMTLTWETKWAINTSSPIIEMASGDLDDLGVEEYSNWLLTPEGHGIQNLDKAFNICIAIKNESTFVSNLDTTWRYFASKEYKLQFDPQTADWWIMDSMPRIWVVSRKEYQPWTT